MNTRLQLRCVVTAALACVAGTYLIPAAHAQTENYFATPWVVEPLPSDPSNVNANGNSAQELGSRSPGAYSNLYARSLAQSAPNAPAWNVSINLGVDEIATDNVKETATNRLEDLSSLFSVGGIVTADSTRMSGTISATEVYRRNINDAQLDGFSTYGYANAAIAILPGIINFSLHGRADDILRLGGGLQNALVQTPQETQMYQVSGSPSLSFRVGDVGQNVLRYQAQQVWFNNNTGSIGLGGQSIGPLSSSTGQTLREDFKMPGSILPRLMSDLSLSAMENDSGLLGSGRFIRERGELINEYELTRSISAIFSGGYERLHDVPYSSIDGEDPVWNGGVRLRPNADSYVLLYYGRHDLKSDFGGEISWRLTALTNIYAAYTDSISNSQQSLLSGSDISQLGPEGALSGVSFDQSTIIGTLDDTALNARPGEQNLGAVLGIPLSDAENALPLQNGLFRNKSLQASAHSELSDQDHLSLTLYYLNSTPLTPAGGFGTPIGKIETTEGGRFSWYRALAENLSGSASIAYSHLNLDGSAVYNASLQVTQVLSHSFSLSVRYDITRRDAVPSSAEYLQNSITIGLHKTFD